MPTYLPHCFRLACLVALSIAAVQSYGTCCGAEKNLFLRGGLENARAVFETTGKGHVAFIGGSITEMNGYRPRVAARLAKRFPQTRFTFTDAGISSTCSTTGAFRLRRDVLDKGPVDLLFVEFAVNDDQDAAHSRANAIRGMEGIVRQVRRHNPQADVVFTYFVNPGMLELLQAGKTPTSIAAHEAVAQHYQVPTNHLAQELADRISAGKFTWKQYGGTHPAPAGNELCAAQIGKLFDLAWAAPRATETHPQPHKLPDPLDQNSYAAGRFIDPGHARFTSGWKLHTPDWNNLPGSCRGRFAQEKMLCATQPGSEATLAFNGRAVGAYVLAGPDAARVEARVDGGPWRTIDLYHHYSAGLHYPRTVMLASDLEPGEHTLQLRVAKESNPASKGHAVRVLQFTAN